MHSLSIIDEQEQRFDLRSGQGAPEGCFSAFWEPLSSASEAAAGGKREESVERRFGSARRRARAELGWLEGKARDSELQREPPWLASDERFEESRRADKTPDEPPLLQTGLSPV